MWARAAPGPASRWLAGVWVFCVLLVTSFLCIGAAVANRIAIADEYLALAPSASLPLTFSLHLMVELNVLLVVDFVVTKVVVVV